MNVSFSSREIDYAATGYFTKIITDYLKQEEKLQPFYRYPVNEEGIRQSLESRKKFPQDRKLLVEQLRAQYSSLEINEKVNAQVERLLEANTFTVCTAHQPNILTGHLYFIYKILHTIKLAEELNVKFPAEDFVPVFYMGSEDADLDELGHIFIDNIRYEWKTKQTGAVGRMMVDEELISLIKSASSLLIVEQHGEELMRIIEDSYVKGRTVEVATFHLLHKLFGEYGLIVLLPDNAMLKSAMAGIFEDDLVNNTASSIIETSATGLQENYKVQASPREINLFYLVGDKRERIVREKDHFKVLGMNTSFTKDELLNVLKEHPERFSPNVILRGLYQETILPNIAFIGGGGELAYWLEFNELFRHYKIPFPVLILRNSFLVVNNSQARLLEKTGFDASNLFRPQQELNNEIVRRHSKHQLTLLKEKEKVQKLFEEISDIAGKIDNTLSKHALALHKKLQNKLESLEKKMLRAERKKFDAENRQLSKLFQQLFPKDSLQERVENFMPYYAKWGKEFIEMLYKNSRTLEQKFTIISEDKRANNSETLAVVSKKEKMA